MITYDELCGHSYRGMACCSVEESGSKWHHSKNFLQQPFIRNLPESHLKIGGRSRISSRPDELLVVQGASLCALV